MNDGDHEIKHQGWLLAVLIINTVATVATPLAILIKELT